MSTTVMTKPSPATLAKSEVKPALSNAAFVKPREVVKINITTDDLIWEIYCYAEKQLDDYAKEWSRDRWTTAHQYLEVLMYGNPDSDSQVKIEVLDRNKVREAFAFAMYKFSKLLEPDEELQIPGTRMHTSDWYGKLKAKTLSKYRNAEPTITVEELGIDQ